jgi:hypothetical protein
MLPQNGADCTGAGPAVPHLRGGGGPLKLEFVLDKVFLINFKTGYFFAQSKLPVSYQLRRRGLLGFFLKHFCVGIEKFLLLEDAQCRSGSLPTPAAYLFKDLGTDSFKVTVSGSRSSCTYRHLNHCPCLLHHSRVYLTAVILLLLHAARRPEPAAPQLLQAARCDITAKQELRQGAAWGQPHGSHFCR